MSQVYPCKNAKHLLHELHTLQLNDSSGDWIFRGQRDSSWGLTPGLFRLRQSHGLSLEDIKLFEAKMKEGLQAVLKARTLTPLHHFEDDKYLLALAQHYGAPTRVLDWTSSPEAAAYFAASGAVVNAAQAGTFSVFAMASIYENNYRTHGCKIISPATGGNENMAAQRGIFMLHDWEVSDLWDSEQEVHTQTSPIVDAEISTRLLRFDVPFDRASELVHELFSRGVEGSNIYPGNRGLVQFALDQTWQYRAPLPK